MNKMELIIHNGDSLYYPVVEEGITWETARKGMPGKLAFNVLNDGSISFQEGDVVDFHYDRQEVFRGFVFTKKRSKDKIIKVTAYDQIRYLKNKDTYVYTNKKASDVIKMLAADFELIIGDIEDTEYVIASRVEDNTTLMDMSQNALDLTLQNRKKLYVLYDDFGKLTLKDIEGMKLDILIDEEGAENFDYTTSIDSGTYNKIKLSYENKETGRREIYIAQDSSNMNRWGVLQYFDTIEENTNGKVKADALLSLHNRKTRDLRIKNVFGDVRVRGGSGLIIKLNLGDITVQNYMIVDTVKHTFNKDEHFMDLTMMGGETLA